MKIAEMPARNIIYAVLAGNVELGLGPFQKDMAAFETVPLYTDSRHLVVSPRHPRYEDMIRGDESALKLTPLIASALDSPDMRPFDPAPAGPVQHGLGGQQPAPAHPHGERGHGG